MENTTTIPELDPIPSIDGNELLVARDGNTDKNLDISSLAQFVLSQLQPNTVSSLIQAATNNNLDATTLAGQVPNFFRDANNLNAGKVPEARLPNGTFGGTFNTGSEAQSFSWFVPSFLTNGPISEGRNLLIQGGASHSMRDNVGARINYLIPYHAGPSNHPNSKPLVFVTPTCFGSEGLNLSTPRENVELDVRAHDVGLEFFRLSSIRTSGNSNDRVVANWLSIGFA